jgi:outer membrane receptor protein involved in Fe transport
LVVDQAYIGDFHTHFKDLAVFGELTWHLTDAWSLTGGTRVFKQTVDQSQQTGLLFAGPNDVANKSLGDEWRKALWKLNTSFQIDKTNLVYATWSQGFRRGGVNALPANEPIPEPPPFGDGTQYITNPRLNHLDPDTVDNYEVGFKGTYENRFSYSAAIFDMQWHNIQEGVQLTPLVLPAALNIGDAYSRGLEVELNASFTRHLAANLDYTYDQTKLTSISPSFVFPDVSVPAPAIGTPLPGTPKTSVALGLEYQHVKVGEGELRFAADAHYQSVVIPALSATVPSVPGFTMVNTRVTYTQSHWMGTLYVDNVTNNLGIGAYTDPALYGNRWQAVVSRPRTVGVTFGYSFKGY